eukprot:353592-Chlamydomonas_euryale.AAC.3
MAHLQQRTTEVCSSKQIGNMLPVLLPTVEMLIKSTYERVLRKSPRPRTISTLASGRVHKSNQQLESPAMLRLRRQRNLIVEALRPHYRALRRLESTYRRPRTPSSPHFQRGQMKQSPMLTCLPMHVHPYIHTHPCSNVHASSRVESAGGAIATGAAAATGTLITTACCAACTTAGRTCGSPRGSERRSRRAHARGGSPRRPAGQRD